MNTADLGGPLLKAVSRTFYLTLRILPASLRAPLSLAYLLARTSDTIADAAHIPREARRRHLAAFQRMLREGGRKGVDELQRDIQPELAGERELIAKLDRCLAWLDALAPTDRRGIEAVLEKIIRGQTLDLERFPATDSLRALRNAAELEEYTYLVAGSVGEFWTQLCTRHLPRYSHIDLEELSALGRNFGKGLQLTNILRDIPSDLRAGRCYLPADELRSVGAEPETILKNPAAAKPVWEEWLQRACAWLDDGFRYIAAVRPARVRAGCFLPWHLGMATLRRMQLRSPLESEERIKVSRTAVRAALFLAVPVALSNTTLRLLRDRHHSSRSKGSVPAAHPGPMRGESNSAASP